MKTVVLSEKYNYKDVLKSKRNTRIITLNTMRNSIVYWEELLEKDRERGREKASPN